MPLTFLTAQGSFHRVGASFLTRPGEWIEAAFPYSYMGLIVLIAIIAYGILLLFFVAAISDSPPKDSEQSFRPGGPGGPAMVDVENLN